MWVGMDTRIPEQPAASPAALLRLLQLVSPALPVGAYHFSQGLEYAIEAGWVTTERTAGDWIEGIAVHGLGALDIPILLRMQGAWAGHLPEVAIRWNDLLLAQRETAELRSEERHLGAALAKILSQAGLIEAKPWTHNGQATFALLFALASARWQIPVRDAACGLAWAWAENQVLGAVKLIPLGQSAGQRLLDQLGARIPSIVERAAALEDDQLAIGSPAQGFASILHETQYSRLFRS